MPREFDDEDFMPRRRPPYFWWILANALALCFAVVSWVACLHVFGNPEVPRNYEILRKLRRLPDLKRYTALEAPNGNVLEPKSLYSKFMDSSLSAEHLARLNRQFVRNYLNNYERPLLLTYVQGDYQIEAVRKLGPKDFVPEGIAVLARALVKPDEFSKPAEYPVVIEYLFPTTEAPAEPFHPGDILTVTKSPNCAAIMHVSRLQEKDEPLLCLTVIPIAYGPYRVGERLTFGIEPPKEVNPGAEFPVFKK